MAGPVPPISGPFRRAFALAENSCRMDSARNPLFGIAFLWSSTAVLPVLLPQWDVATTVDVPSVSDVSCYGQIRSFSSITSYMPKPPPPAFPSERRLLEGLGDRLRLARKRRKFSTETVSQRAGISRMTLYRLERGDGAVTLGTCLRVLAVLGLDQDLEKLARDDELGRRLQDLALEPDKRK